MADQSDERTTRLRYLVYGLLILISCSALVGRILTVAAPHGRTPFHSANDRSRWSTIRSLVDHGTYVIDEVIRRDESNRGGDWDSIDKVRHRGHDGRQHFYSSKPTLLPTLLAGKYWVIQQATGATLRRNPFYVARLMLVLTNVVPLVIYFILMARLVERYGRTDWGRMFVMAAATFGTFLTTFGVTLNNHLPAAISVAIAVHAAVVIWYGGERQWWWFALAGLFSAFAAANELPALSFFCAIGVAVLWKSPGKTAAAFLPAAAVVFAGFFYTNHLAHDSWRPAYAHRRDGKLVKTCSVQPIDSLEAARRELLTHRPELERDLGISSAATLDAARMLQPTWKGEEIASRWELSDPKSEQRYAVLYFSRERPAIQIHAWDQWYEYPGSYWLTEKTGVDCGEPSRLTYAMHMLVGHHGIFSLTPIWILAVLGMGIMLFGRRPPSLRALTLMIVTLSLVCLLFYIARPLKDRNYGGVTCGLRWMFWFTPLWLICLIPAADTCSNNRWLRIMAYVALAVSIFSAHYASLNPWTPPWIYNYLQYLSG